MGGEAGWFITRSLPMELDIAIYIAGGSLPPSWLTPEIEDLARRTPPGWVAEGAAILAPLAELGNHIQTAARTAGVLLSEEYGQATLTIRELTIDEAIALEAERLAPLGIEAGTGGEPSARYADMVVGGLMAFGKRLGLPVQASDPMVRITRAEALRVARVLRGGDAAARFWHWLDRYYYECYKPWREERLEVIAAQELRCEAALGGRVGAAPPNVSWLPPQNPLLHTRDLADAVRAGQVRVGFWAEPFGLFDSWTFDRQTVLVSFGVPGVVYANFREHAQDIARRVQALADPTRLAILRMIRGMAVSNTDIAAYLELARPTVSIHAKQLREAGLISTHSAGREARHALVAAELRRLFRDLEQFLDLPPEEG